MKKMGLSYLALLFSGLTSLVIVACGGGAASPTPAPPSPIATVKAAPTPTAAAPSPAGPTVAAPTPRATVVAPTPTPAPTTAPSPTAKRGGLLQLRGIVPLVTWDTYDARGRGDFYIVAPLLDNLVWVDPYGDGRKVIGDIAERWQFSADGKVLSFFVRKGIGFHDGSPLTARDVVYNLERAWKPRGPTMTLFKGRFAPVGKIEAPDDLTVRVTLSEPSNSFFGTLSTVGLLLYPAHFPFPERNDQWKRTPIGSGPFRFKAADDTKVEFVRNPSYWKPGLPHLDGIVFTMMLGNDIAVAALRAGRTDVEAFVGSAVELLFRQAGRRSPFVYFFNNFSINSIHVNQRPPWAAARVREALSLGLDRQAIVDIWLQGRGSPFAAPLLPPERGGQWGISTEVMKGRPGFRPNKAEDLARAKRLLADAGVDPKAFTVSILNHPTTAAFGEVVERSVADLGFKTSLFTSATAERGDRALRGDFDLSVETIPFQLDDPSDYLGIWVQTGGGGNYGKWSNARLDALFAEQDKALDVAKRKQLLLELQEVVLSDNTTIPAVYRDGVGIHMEWVKNYPSQLPFWWSPRYRYEQVWLDR